MENKIPLSRILVADDLNRENKAEAPAAVRLALALARRSGAELRLVHAYEFPKLTMPAEAINFIEQPYVEAMETALDTEATELERANPHLKLVSSVERGAPVEVLLSDAKTHDIDLLVMGTHGRHGVKRAFLGSIAEEVVRRSSVPVLTVNPHAEVKDQLGLSKILVAVDPTDKLDPVLIEAERFARAFGAQLVLMSVVEEWVYPVVQSASLLAGGYIMPLERDLKELGNLRDQQLREVARRFEGSGLDVQTRLIERATGVGEAIVHEAQNMNADLIIIGHHPASRLEYAVLGSVSRYVLREAFCPVLTVPPEGQYAVKSAGLARKQAS